MSSVGCFRIYRVNRQFDALVRRIGRLIEVRAGLMRSRRLDGDPFYLRSARPVGNFLGFHIAVDLSFC